ncbi:hypothetical protein AgCh_009655 [Apium graveolens]
MPRRPVIPWQNRVSAPSVTLTPDPGVEAVTVGIRATGPTDCPHWVRRSVSAVRNFPPGCGPSSSFLRPPVPPSAPIGTSSPIPYHVHRAVNRTFIRDQSPELVAHLDQIPVGPFQGIPTPSPDVQARVRPLTQIAVERARRMPLKKNSQPNNGSAGDPSMRCETPEFKGEVDPVVSRIWLKEMEKAFALTKVSEDLKIDYASYFLKNDSNYWWESTQMEMEFLKLKQGDKSVTEYGAKFTKLDRIAPEYVSSEAQRAKRFQQGLKPKIRSGVVDLQLKMYISVVQAALVIESDQRLAVKEKGEKKRKFEGGPARSEQEGVSQKFQCRFGRNKDRKFRRQNFPQARPNTTSVSSTPTKFNKPVIDCKTCGKKHSGQCKENVNYFKCGQKGHYSTECKSEK